MCVRAIPNNVIYIIATVYDGLYASRSESPRSFAHNKSFASFRSTLTTTFKLNAVRCVTVGKSIHLPTVN